MRYECNTVSVRFAIVIPTSGSLDNCRPLVESLFSALASDSLVEIAIVVNGTHAVQALRESATLLPVHPKIRVVAEPVGSLLAGRHRGVVETTGDVVCFLDDDVAVSDGWFDALVDAFTRFPRLVLAGGPSHPRFLAPPPPWLEGLAEQRDGGGSLSPFMSLVDLGDQKVVPVDPNLIWGLNFSIRRDVLLELGGFHPDLLPASEQMFQGDGETGLTRKIAARGLLAGYFPGLAVTHTIPAQRMTLDYIKKRAFYEGVGEAYKSLRESQRDKTVVSPPTFSRRVRSLVSSAVRSVRTRVPDSWLKTHLQAFVTKHRLRGQEYLRSHYRADPRVREWVGRDDYWDWAHPSAKR